MSILTRFKDIMASNINALLDKAEDPSKMVDQIIRNLEKDLRSVESETAAVMAAERKAKRELEACQEEVNELQAYAKKAVAAGDDDAARKFLESKNRRAASLDSLQKTHQIAAQNAEHMKEMHAKLKKDFAEASRKRNEIKAKMSVARAQQNINKVGASLNNAGNSLDAFSRMAAKADEELDKANAMAELQASSGEEDLSDLKAKFDTTVAAEAELQEMKNSDVEAELQALKAGVE